MMRAKHGKFFSRLIGNTVCNLYPLSGFVQWDVIKGDYLMNIVCTRMDGVVALPTQAAPPETSSSDDMLIQRIAQGDQLAMRTLFGRHQVPLYRWLLRLVGDESLAEDLVSDVFLDVWRQAASFQARSSVSTWLLAIARYKALSARRRRMELDEKIASRVADPSDDPEVALQKKTRAALLRHSLAGLWPEHGEVIDLVYFHGKSIKEVSEIVGIATATVKTRMFYAREKLADFVASA
jgi:RNA polymerase sigma-70 factor (ECF subfamily)